MNAAVNHIMQIVDWKRFTLEEWLYQFGAWMSSVSGTCGRSVNPIAVAMDEAVVKRKSKVKDKAQIIADWMNSDDIVKKNRSKTACQISDNEARAVQRLILDMQGKSEILDEWLDAVVSRYFYNNSWSEMAVNKTVNDARQDVKCGLAAMHVRYPFIVFK